MRVPCRKEGECRRHKSSKHEREKGARLYASLAIPQAVFVTSFITSTKYWAKRTQEYYDGLHLSGTLAQTALQENKQISGYLGLLAGGA
jgi:hypothetical protein